MPEVIHRGLSVMTNGNQQPPHNCHIEGRRHPRHLRGTSVGKPGHRGIAKVNPLSPHLTTTAWTGMSGLLMAILMLTASGCRTAPPMAPVDLAATGWTVKSGQAVWQPKSGAPELAGFILMASSTSGEVFIRFSKDPLEIVLARRNQEGWTLDIPGFNKHYSYRGKPPDRIGWFQLADAVFEGVTADDWEWTDSNQGRWKLIRRRTGERLEGFFNE